MVKYLTCVFVAKCPSFPLLIPGDCPGVGRRFTLTLAYKLTHRAPLKLYLAAILQCVALPIDYVNPGCNSSVKVIPPDLNTKVTLNVTAAIVSGSLRKTIQRVCGLGKRPITRHFR